MICGVLSAIRFIAVLSFAAVLTTERLQAGSYSADFSGNPSPPLSIWSSSGQSGQRLTTGGNSGGHFVLTPASANERSVVKLPDLDPGKLVSAFDFSVDCRIGGGTAFPADGMSVNFVSANDPVVLNGTGFLGPPAGGSDAPEEGTATGLSVCMDSWDNGGADWVGFTVKRNGVVIAQTGADIRHGLLTETGSLQTGPLNRSGGDTTSLLGWARLRIVLYHTGRLDVFWKNVKVINLVQTYWVPMSGHFVIGARTGASAQLHDLDNLSVLTTAPAAAVAEVTPRPARVQFSLLDPSNAVPLSSLALRINGVTAAISNAVTDGSYKRFTWISPAPLIPGATYNYSLTGDNSFNAEGSFRGPDYARIAALQAVAYDKIDTASSGVRIATYQTELVRPDTVLEAERQLRGEYGTNTADTTGAAADGTRVVPIVNFEENAATEGYFNAGTFLYENPADRLIPGIPGNRSTGNRDNYVVEATAYVSLPSGTTRMAVRSDDGFKLTCGLDARSPFAQEIARFDGGRAASDSEFDIHVDAAGYYPFRLLWFEGGGGSSCEWYVILDDGRKIPVGGHRFGTINPPVQPASVTCFARLLPSFTPPRYLDWVEPQPGSEQVPPSRGVEFTVAGSRLPPATATVDGLTAIAEPQGRFSNTFTVRPGHLTDERWFWVDPGEAHTIAVTLDGVTKSWNFRRAVYGVLPEHNATRLGSGRNPGFIWRINQTSKPNPDGNDAAEEILAGVFGPNIATPAAANDWSYNVTGTLNFSQDGFTAGSFPGDRAMPGLAAPFTNAAVEVLCYLEIPVPGFRRLGVNSDDGFRLTPFGAPRSPLRIVAPAQYAGYTPAVESLNAPIGTAPVRGPLAVTVPADASTPLGNAAQVAGKIALVDRSDTVPFSDQIRRCQNAGAIGVMVINNVAAPSIRMTGRGFPEFTIPAVMISGLTGVFLKLDPTPFVVELGRDRTGILGEFDGGRGAGTTDFTFFVPAAGVYPVRLTYEQGGGGGALEFFHYDAATGGGPTLMGAPYSGGPGIPVIYQNRLEPVAPTRLEHLAATRQFRVWLPLTSADLMHIDSAAELYSQTGATWQTLHELIPAPAAGQPWSYTRPIPSNPLSVRQFFRFEVLRGLE